MEQTDSFNLNLWTEDEEKVHGVTTMIFCVLLLWLPLL